MSLEDLRDQYKGLCQSNDNKLKLNGATYRRLRHEMMAKTGNTIVIENTSGIYRGELDELNAKYDLEMSQPYRKVVLSLNKKKRWDLRKDLTEQMGSLAEDKVNVSLYETRNRNEKKSNCIAVHKTSGVPVQIKKTFGNLDSIIKTEKLQEIERLAKAREAEEGGVEPQPPRVPKKNRKCSKPGLNSRQQSRSNQNELIVIDVMDRERDEEANSAHVRYKIEYGAQSDILKYDVRKFVKDKKVGQTTKAPRKFSRYQDEYGCASEDVSDLDEEEEVKEAQPKQRVESDLNVDLDELIDQQLIKSVEKKSLEEMKAREAAAAAAAQEEEYVIVDRKDRKVYVEKESESDSSSEEAVSASRVARKTAKPIEVALDIFVAGTDVESLKSKYGKRYAEAHECWPRMFSINLDEQLHDRLLKSNATDKDFDVVMWLRFAQVVVNNEKNSQANNTQVDFAPFKVSILSNLNCESIGLENINPCSVHSLDHVLERALDFMLSLPIDLYRRKDFPKSWTRASALADGRLYESLPNIGGETRVHSIDDIKLDLIHSSHIRPKQPPPTYNRSNSIEVTKKSLDRSASVQEEAKIGERVASVMSRNAYECILCFDQKQSLDDCVILKSCAHCFCRTCMQEYIDSVLANTYQTAGELQCPGCKCQLELALMINYSSDAQLTDVFMRKTVERVVFVLNDYKWCPSPFCGRVLQVDLNSNPYGTVSCTCGFRMCLRCNNPPHFPAKCSQIANYYAELKINNDFAEPEDHECVSLGKRCPLCSTFIEKNGGCNHMYCVTCKKYFCWNCLVEWEEHNRNGGRCSSGKGEKYGQVRIEFRKDRKPIKQKSNQVKYEDSLNHRKMRTHKTKRTLLNDAKRILDTLKFTNNTDEPFLKDLDEQKEKRDEVKSYLQSMVEFVNEMHFVCEHAYVLISDKSLPHDTVVRVRNLITSIELNIWLIESLFKNGSGSKALDEMRRHHEKSLRCVKLLKAIKTNNE